MIPAAQLATPTPRGIFGSNAVTPRGFLGSRSLVVTGGYLTSPPADVGYRAFWGRVRIQPNDNILYLHNHNLVQLLSLVELDTGAYENGAQVQLQLFDNNEREVAGPMIMPYVAGSNGNYQVTIPFLTQLKANRGYTVTITVTTPDNFAEWNVPVQARWREGP